jgi:hypothetical protein
MRSKDIFLNFIAPRAGLIARQRRPDTASRFLRIRALSFNAAANACAI